MVLYAFCMLQNAVVVVYESPHSHLSVHHSFFFVNQGDEIYLSTQSWKFEIFCVVFKAIYTSYIVCITLKHGFIWIFLVTEMLQEMYVMFMFMLSHVLMSPTHLTFLNPSTPQTQLNSWGECYPGCENSCIISSVALVELNNVTTLISIYLS